MSYCSLSFRDFDFQLSLLAAEYNSKIIESLLKLPVGHYYLEILRIYARKVSILCRCDREKYWLKHQKEIALCVTVDMLRCFIKSNLLVR